jgi:hypothetical protein
MATLSFPLSTAGTERRYPLSPLLPDPEPDTDVGPEYGRKEEE